MKRFQYTGPKNLYEPWRFNARRSNDEWLNKSWALRVPFLGEFALFPGHVDRSGWYALGVFGDSAEFASPCGKYYASVDYDKITKVCNCMPECGIPLPLSYEEIVRLGTIREVSND